MADLRDTTRETLGDHEQRIRVLEKNVEALMTQLNEARVKLDLAEQQTLKAPRR